MLLQGSTMSMHPGTVHSEVPQVLNSSSSFTEASNSVYEHIEIHIKIVCKDGLDSLYPQEYSYKGLVS